MARTAVVERVDQHLPTIVQVCNTYSMSRSGTSHILYTVVDQTYSSSEKILSNNYSGLLIKKKQSCEYV
jgi:hypothetical protein